MITVFTPTYNRAYILPNLYESLKRQSYKNFEWIVIDDGSSDNTEYLIKNWIKENNFFNIIYKKTVNKGKHVAINKGVNIAKGELFFIVDSDDFLSDNALERVIFWENTIKTKELFVGVSGNRSYFDGTLIGTTFNSNNKHLDCTYIERRKYNINGDKAEVYYTKILKKYPFPEFENENFCCEALVWLRIARDGYKIRYFNESIYFTEYRDDGLTKNILKKYRENPYGALLFYKEATIFQKNNFKRFLKNGSFYYLYGIFKGYRLKELQKDLGINKVESFLLYILSLIRRYIKKQI